MWVADREGYPASVTVDLQGVKSVDGIEFAFLEIRLVIGL